jgi:hypothetical protein
MSHHLAQLNIARIRFPIDSPQLKPFMDGFAGLNALAEASPGFVWRLVGNAEAGNALTGPFGDDVVVNMSVWESVQALWDFTYASGHLDFMRRRREWLDHQGITAHLVLWWVPAGHVPDEREGAQRLAHLHQHGPTGHAFTFRDRMPAPA